jgi:hypothetical protein
MNLYRNFADAQFVPNLLVEEPDDHLLRACSRNTIFRPARSSRSSASELSPHDKVGLEHVPGVAPSFGT